LSAILSYAHLLRVGPVDIDAINRAVTVIERNAKAQIQIIEDLLDSARITTGKLRIEPALIKLVPCSKPRSTPSVRRLRQRASRWSSIANRSPPKHWAIRRRLQQIVSNLLTNAIKFTPEGGRVSLAMKHDADQIRIMVSDTGEGIEPGFLPFVFQRFSQADTSSARRFGGLGLGLSLVRIWWNFTAARFQHKARALGAGRPSRLRFRPATTEFVLSPPADDSSPSD
jgi:signal transduction histidine kinase